MLSKFDGRACSDGLKFFYEMTKNMGCDVPGIGLAGPDVFISSL